MSTISLKVVHMGIFYTTLTEASPVFSHNLSVTLQDKTERLDGGVLASTVVLPEVDNVMV